MVSKAEEDSSEESNPDEDIKDLTIAGDGYRTLLLKFDDQEDEETDVVQAFIERYHAELSAYYSLIRLNRKRSKSESEILARAEDLLEDTSSFGLIKKFRHWNSYSARIDAVFDEYLQTKPLLLHSKKDAKEITSDDLINEKSPFYKNFLKPESDKDSIFLDEDIRELLIMLEERRRGYFENLATFGSGLAGALIGAIIGATATLWTGAQQSSPPSKPNVTIPSETLDTSKK